MTRTRKRPEGTYKIHVACDNCDYRGMDMESVGIPYGKKVCPNCQCKQLSPYCYGRDMVQAGPDDWGRFHVRINDEGKGPQHAN